MDPERDFDKYREMRGYDGDKMHREDRRQEKEVPVIKGDAEWEMPEIQFKKSLLQQKYLSIYKYISGLNKEKDNDRDKLMHE